MPVNIIVHSQQVVERVDGDNLVMRVLLDGHPLNVIIPLAAIDNRRALYELASDDEAIDALLREHYVREKMRPVQGGPAPFRHPNGKLRPAQGREEKALLAGGMTSGITIERPPTLVEVKNRGQ